MTAANTENVGWNREEMAKRTALDIPDGSYVNLGIGIPEKVAKYEEMVEIYQDELSLEMMVIKVYHTILDLDPANVAAVEKRAEIAADNTNAAGMRRFYFSSFIRGCT